MKTTLDRNNGLLDIAGGNHKLKETAVESIQNKTKNGRKNFKKKTRASLSCRRTSWREEEGGRTMLLKERPWPGRCEAWISLRPSHLVSWQRALLSLETAGSRTWDWGLRQAVLETLVRTTPGAPTPLGSGVQLCLSLVPWKLLLPFLSGLL